MAHLSLSLLIAGGARVLLWALLAYVAYTCRRWILLAGASLAACNAAVFSLSNAGGYVPKGLFTTAAYLATPAVALIVTHGVIALREHLVMRTVLRRELGGGPSSTA